MNPDHVDHEDQIANSDAASERALELVPKSMQVWVAQIIDRSDMLNSEMRVFASQELALEWRNAYAKENFPASYGKIPAELTDTELADLYFENEDRLNGDYFQLDAQIVIGAEERLSDHVYIIRSKETGMLWSDNEGWGLNPTLYTERPDVVPPLGYIDLMKREAAKEYVSDLQLNDPYGLVALRFVGQKWIGDIAYADPNDELVFLLSAKAIDICTGYGVKGLNHESDQMARFAYQELLNLTDDDYAMDGLAEHEYAPSVVRDWNGPFEVEVIDADSFDPGEPAFEPVFEAENNSPASG